MRLLALIVVVTAAMAAEAFAEGPASYQLDPFAQATSGFGGCPTVAPPTLTLEQMRTQAHERAERGTSCCLAGTCECGGAYKRDPEINARVVDALRGDRRFRDTSLWVTTMRKFVTVQGCVRTPAQKRAVERLVRRQQDVAVVWNETSVGPVTKASIGAK
jgi:hypothetical protein